MKSRLKALFSESDLVIARLRQRSPGVLVAIVLTFAAAIALIVSLSGAGESGMASRDRQGRLVTVR